MRTIILVMNAASQGQIQRVFDGRISGKQTNEMLAAHRAVLIGAHWRVRSTRTINEAGVRWAFIFVER